MTAKIENFEINYEAFMIFLKENLKVDCCKYFIANFKFNEGNIENLKSMGVEIISKEIYFQNSKLKANCDVEISHEITKDILENSVDRVVLISGDGDFFGLLNYVKVKEKQVKLIAIHPKHTSKIYKSGNKFSLSYLTQILEKINKRKALPKHGSLARGVFDNSSIANPKNLSSLDLNREIIDSVDSKILELFKQRFDAVLEIGKYKKENNIKPLDENRWSKVLNKNLEKAKILGLDTGFVNEVYESVHNHALSLEK